MVSVYSITSNIFFNNSLLYYKSRLFHFNDVFTFFFNFNLNWKTVVFQNYKHNKDSFLENEAIENRIINRISVLLLLLFCVAVINFCSAALQASEFMCDCMLKHKKDRITAGLLCHFLLCGYTQAPTSLPVLLSDDILSPTGWFKLSLVHTKLLYFVFTKLNSLKSGTTTSVSCTKDISCFLNIFVGADG